MRVSTNSCAEPFLTIRTLLLKAVLRSRKRRRAPQHRPHLCDNALPTFSQEPHHPQPLLSHQRRSFKTVAELKQIEDLSDDIWSISMRR